MFVFAALSYYYVERPCANFARKFTGKPNAARALEPSPTSSSA